MTSPFGFTSKTDGVDDHLAAHVNALQLAADVLAKSHDGEIFNGKISISVATNDITVALKTIDGNNPSSTDPVYISIDGTVRSLTSALSITKNDGTNWFGSGGTKFATQEIDYFVYIIWDSAAVDIGFARIPYALTMADFSSTTTNEKYIASATAAGSSSLKCAVIGRFNAILSGTAAFNWSLPATQVIVQRPIFHTRRLTWVPALVGYSVDPSSAVYEYMIRDNYCEAWINEGADGTSNATNLTLTMPFTSATLTNMAWPGFGFGRDNGTALTTTVRLNLGSNSATLNALPNGASSSTWTNVNGKRIVTGYIKYAIA